MAKPRIAAKNKSYKDLKKALKNGPDEKLT